MEAIVLIHGITGSKLSYKQGAKLLEVWPPDLGDLGGYSEAKFDILLDKPLKVTGIIDTVLCFQVYAPIEADLKDISNNISASYEAFCYDWRENLFKSMDGLAARLKAIGSKKQINSITLICHSMGGLIARLLMESGIYSAPKNPWFGKIKRALFVCTPHLGAPVALSEFLGLERVDLISRTDVQRAANEWQSAYQLLPAPAYPDTVILENGTPEDFYQRNVALKVKLDPNKLTNITEYTFGMLNFANKPSAIQYNFIVGTSQKTDVGIDIDSTGSPITYSPYTNFQGDGTVPMVSAGYTGNNGVPVMIVGDHINVMATFEFQRTLYDYFGVSVRPALHPRNPTAVVSLNKRVYRPGEEMSVLIIPDVKTDTIATTLRLRRLAGRDLVPHGTERKIVYRGGAVKFLQMTLTAPSEAGGFRIDLEGDDATHLTTDRTAACFAVARS